MSRDIHPPSDPASTVRQSSFRLLRSGAGDPAFNLGLDEALLSLARPQAPPILRLYGWRPCGLSLGLFQRAEDLPPGFSPPEPWALVRRPTGGGAILHADEITYSVVVSVAHPLLPGDASGGYARFHAPLLGALAQLGAEASSRGAGQPSGHPRPSPFFCFELATASDLVSRGRKILGSAQRRTRAGFLQHGSLPLQGSAGARAGAISLSEAAGRPISYWEAEAAIIEAFALHFGTCMVEDEPSAVELACAERLADERYRNPSYTWRRRRTERGLSPRALASAQPQEVR